MSDFNSPIRLLRDEAERLANAAERANHAESIELTERAAAFHRAANLLVKSRNLAGELRSIALRLYPTEK